MDSEGEQLTESADIDERVVKALPDKLFIVLVVFKLTVELILVVVSVETVKLVDIDFKWPVELHVVVITE